MSGVPLHLGLAALTEFVSARGQRLRVEAACKGAAMIKDLGHGRMADLMRATDSGMLDLCRMLAREPDVRLQYRLTSALGDVGDREQFFAAHIIATTNASLEELEAEIFGAR